MTYQGVLIVAGLALLIVATIVDMQKPREQTSGGLVGAVAILYILELIR